MARRIVEDRVHDFNQELDHLRGQLDQIADKAFIEFLHENSP
jgi:hypothetical protein